MTLSELSPLSLPLLVLGAALIVLLADIALPKNGGRHLGLFMAAAFAAIFGASFFLDSSGRVFDGVWVGGDFTLFFDRVFLLAGTLACLGSLDHVARHMPGRQGEYYLLLAASVLGMMLLPGARDLILLVVCFELMGMPLYLLAGWAKTDDTRGRGKNAAEAALKFYLVGAVSSVFLLLGLALVVGMSGTTSIEALGHMRHSALFDLGLLTLFGGMGFKIGVVPFHMWVPDTYEGAPTPFVAFLSVAPKAAGFAALTVVFLAGFHVPSGSFMPLMLLLAATTMIVGNLFALRQESAKRLLAYSGITQVGYMLLAFATGTRLGTAMLLFYLLGYTVTNIGAFMVIEATASGDQGEDRVSDFDGLYARSPALALAMLLFLLSLAGIPFVVGFWAKLYVFIAAWEAGHGVLVFLGAVLAVVALFYYMRIARAMYMNEPKDTSPIKTPFGVKLAIAICLAGVVGMGAYPAPFLEQAMLASRSLFG
ncbi:MAG: NADH-quinone oxidoreductase subunit N [Deltaproteobacteria bacterium]|nr:NADH-quinone oxidoreductase subunit N [Deltaproteobacteria bacterium]